MSLTELYDQISSADNELQKEAEEMDKLAAEEEAAGRITARGFMDELQKMAQQFGGLPAPGAAPKPDKMPVLTPKPVKPKMKFAPEVVTPSKVKPGPSGYRPGERPR